MNKKLLKKGCQDLGMRGPQFKKYELGNPEKTGNMRWGEKGKRKGEEGGERKEGNGRGGGRAEAENK